MRKESIFLIIAVISFMVTLIAIYYSKSVNDTKRIQMINFKDSLENEFYKKQLETFPFEHSEIKDTTVKNINQKN